MLCKQSLLESIGTTLSEITGEETELQWIQNLSGGDINQAALLRSGGTNWFLKYHEQAPAGMFEAEALALSEISAQGQIKVPAPIALGQDGNTTWLLLEHLELTSRGPASLLGEQLAALHAKSFDQYGWTRDNFIGSTPQFNSTSDSWSEFWRDHRLKPQLEMAKTAAMGTQLISKGERLLESMDQVMDGHRPKASLLHGDLWGGNKAYTHDGQPVIFDPASYHGDREADIAMTELFGGFEQDFYSAYRAHSPLADGYHLRRDLYNLYHMLNHFNLFGVGYLSRCERMIDDLLAQVR